MSNYNVKKSGRPPKYDHEKIKSMILAGMSNRAIAKDIGCHYQQVSFLKVRWGLAKKKPRRMRG